jgi:hypothetical protein
MPKILAMIFETDETENRRRLVNALRTFRLLWATFVERLNETLLFTLRKVKNQIF